MLLLSVRLKKLLRSKNRLTFQDVINTFGYKSFAVILLLLMIIPALPLPTGGVTHLFEIIAALIAVELFAGRDTIWLPKRWLNKSLPISLQNSLLPKVLKFIIYVENNSKPRLRGLQENIIFYKIISFAILCFIIFAFIGPPFTGLDTLPSMGVVLISLGILFNDFLFSVLGLIFGFIGVVLIIFLGTLAINILS